MRKRGQARPSNAEDMWFTMPRKETPTEERAAEVPSRSEQPTYEDTWYQILRASEDEAASAAVAEGAVGEGDGDATDDRDDDRETDDDGTDDEVLAEPQHASSLD